MFKLLKTLASAFAFVLTISGKFIGRADVNVAALSPGFYIFHSGSVRKKVLVAH